VEATSNDPAAAAHGLGFSGGLIAHRKRLYAPYKWLGAAGWMGGGMWIWTVIGVLVVVLLVVLINKGVKKVAARVRNPPPQ
jgi:uncharacterized membrane protein